MTEIAETLSPMPSVRPHRRGYPSMIPAALSDNYVVQVQRSDSIRDIRSTLLEAVYFLRGQGNPLLQAVCVLLGSKVSPKRLAAELALFKAVVDPGLAKRIHLANVQKG